MRGPADPDGRKAGSQADSGGERHDGRGGGPGDAARGDATQSDAAPRDATRGDAAPRDVTPKDVTKDLSRMLAEGCQNPHELLLDLPAAHSAGRMARQVLRRFAAAENVPEDEVKTLEFVADELLTNAIDHGGGHAAREESDLAADVRVAVQLFVRGGTWELRVEDQGGGKPEDLAHVVSDDELPDLEDERGRGFFLIRGMVDGLRVEKSRDGRGLAFVATKRYAPDAG